MKGKTLAICMAALGISSIAGAQTTIQGLGYLTGKTDSEAQAISNNGTFVAGTSGKEAFVWTAQNGMKPVGFLPNQSESYAYGVSNGGVVVGSSQNPAFQQAFIWDMTNGMRSLGVLPNAVESVAFGVSADGTTVVGESGGRPFIWTSVGGMQEIGNASNGKSAAFAVSSDGTVVTGTYNGQPFRWTLLGGVVSLPNFGFGGASNTATAMSSNGNVIVGSALSTSMQMYRWTSSTGPEQPLATDGTQPVMANAVNDDGSIIAATQNNKAQLWFAASGPEDAMSFLSSGGSTKISSWTQLNTITGITPDGTHFVGTGINIKGHTDAFIATMVPPVNPGNPDMAASSMSPAPRVGGNPIAFQVNLNGPAPSNGATIDLQSFSPDIVLATSTQFKGGSGVMIPSGGSSGIDGGMTKGVAANETVHAVATYNFVARYASIVLQPAKLYTPTLDNSTVTGGSKVIMTLKLNGQAPAAGGTVNLTSDNPTVAPIQDHAIFSSYGTTVQVPITTTAVTTQTTVTITAKYGGYMKQVTITVNP